MSRTPIPLLAAFLAALAVGSCVLLTYVATDAVQRARPLTPVLFDHGLTAVDPQAPAEWTNEQCGRCHEAAYQQWADSKHALAGLNKNFEAQMSKASGGRAQWCVNCHAPINPGLSNFASTEPQQLDAAFKERREWLKRGVDCLSCHVRDGHVLGTRVTKRGEQAHPMRLAPELGTAEFCGGCHQFSHKPMQYADAFRGRLQQASLEEFLEYRREHQAESRCHDCHMPDGNHFMPGGYDKDMVASALRLDVKGEYVAALRGVRIAVEIEAQGVGHRVPGGEHLFRYLTVSTLLSDQQGALLRGSSASQSGSPQDGMLLVTRWPRSESIRKRQGRYESGTDPAAGPTLDTRLTPGKPRRYTYLFPWSGRDEPTEVVVRTTVRYHVLDEEEAREFGLDPEPLVWEVKRKSREFVVPALPPKASSGD